MPTIQRPLYEGFSSRHLAVKGVGAMAEVADEVLGVIQLDRIAKQENWWTQRIQGFARGFESNVTSSSHYAWWGLNNPDGSGVLCTILSFHNRDQGTGTTNNVKVYQINRADPTASPYSFSAVSGTGVSTDTRGNGIRSLCRPITRSSTDSSWGDKMYDWHGSVDPFSCESILPLVIAPNSSFVFRPQDTNDNQNVSMCWVEIPAYSAEL